jgi:adenylate kinase
MLEYVLVGSVRSCERVGRDELARVAVEVQIAIQTRDLRRVRRDDTDIVFDEHDR